MHLYREAIPQLTKAFTESLSVLTTTFADSNRRHQETAELMQRSFTERNERMQEAFKKSIANLELALAESQKAYFHDLREQRHDFRNVLQTQSTNATVELREIRKENIETIKTVAESAYRGSYPRLEAKDENLEKDKE